MQMKKRIRNILIILGSLLVVSILVLVILWFSLTSSVSDSKETVKLVIEPGMSRDDIAFLLKENGLIKNERVFKFYLKIKDVNNIYAATYYLNPSMDLDEVVLELSRGGVNENEIEITFREGMSVKDYAKVIANNTDNSEEDVLNLLKNKDYLNKLIKDYWFITSDILNKNIYYPLEGYLFPDTYRFNGRDVSAEDIFKKMLDEMNEVLTPYKDIILDSKYSISQILTMASMTELEGIDEESRKGIAGVFYNRLEDGMSLGIDATTYYAFQVSMAERSLTQAEFDTFNLYNTRGPKMEGKLPVGPIACVSKQSILAVIYPTASDNYYYVSDKNGKIYFTKTNSEHEAIIAKLKKEGKWLEW